MARKSLRSRAMSGEMVLGAMVFEFFSPGIAQVLRLAGAEYVIYDMEHTGIGFETIKAQVAHCRGLDIAPMVRVPRGEYHFLARALDIGCHGIMIPMVESVAQARSIVDSTHYPPRGRRGAAFAFPHDDYAPGDPLAKMKAADARTLIMAQIETERGLECVEDIAAVDGIDVLWLGHFDLTNFLGVPGQFDNPVYLNAVKRIVAAGRKHKKGLGVLSTDPTWAKQYKRLGFNMHTAGTDHGLLMTGVKGILSPIAD